MNNNNLALPAEQDRAVAATPSSPQAVSPVPASIPSAGDLASEISRIMLQLNSAILEARKHHGLVGAKAAPLLETAWSAAFDARRVMEAA
jgi:hypothetical protein